MAQFLRQHSGDTKQQIERKGRRVLEFMTT
jgi:hypothetical protein